ncbi:hypothetical protein HNY73_019570 [Argiope bruennichi]|uniref:Secreted protein n=1 Tax=Argiope bruennichi TaxID=94029 RepID=A0A8T0E5H5_ARGBR|nr:hypothetical protein HNY73_019570 [Argiope bruennichi]
MNRRPCNKALEVSMLWFMLSHCICTQPTTTQPTSAPHHQPNHHYLHIISLAIYNPSSLKLLSSRSHLSQLIQPSPSA